MILFDLEEICCHKRRTMIVSSAQVRAARGLIDWSQSQLAKEAGVGLSTIADFERGKRTPIGNNLVAIQRALEAAGVEFTPENGGGAGVRLRKRMAPPDEGIRPNQLTSENDA
jgi:transcriptional regulator with XRE-family HTH domain